MPKPTHIVQTWSPLGARVCFALLYGVGTWLGMQLKPDGEQLSALWPPSGVLLAALLLSRWRQWPVLLTLAVLVGPLASQPGHWPPSGPLLMAASNGLEALVGAFLLRRYAGLRPSLERVRDVLALLAISVLTPVLSATPGVTLLLYGKLRPEEWWGQWWVQWRVFWVGDVIGVLLGTPLLLTWGLRNRAGWSRARGLEFALLLLALVCTLRLSLTASAPATEVQHLITYTAFPFILWAALRFGARGTSMVLLTIALLFLPPTLKGRGPFAPPPKGPATSRLLYLQSFLAVVGSSGLLLAATVGELSRSREKSERLNDKLRHSLQELATAQRELVRSERMAAVGELSASVAHEVRNPLGVIANAVATLIRMSHSEASSTTLTLLGVMGEEVERLDLLVTGLVEFARPLEPRLLRQPVGPVVEGALESALGSVAHAASIQVARAVDATVEASLDAHLMHRALENLFLNALQAMPLGGTLQVGLARVDTPSSPSLAVITIGDTGPGITPEVMKRLFEPFFTTKALGAGLGLAIMRGIVEAHRGQVDVHTRLRQGTTFTLRLPLLPLPRVPPREEGSAAQKGMPSSSLPPP